MSEPFHLNRPVTWYERKILDEYERATAPIDRECLSCERPFVAHGRTNRICLRCKSTEHGGYTSRTKRDRA